MNDKGFANGVNDPKRGIDFIGISCGFVCHDGHGKFLLSKRSKNCRDEQGAWETGGGSQEFDESIEETIRRELKEEYGADALDMKFVKVYDIQRKLPDGTSTHWVSIVYAVKVDPKQAKNNEPYKIDEIGWFAMDSLPSPLHSGCLPRLEAVHDVGII